VKENQEVQIRRRRSREEIKRLVVEYESSGAQVRDFCRDHALAPGILRRHLRMRRLGKVEPKESKGLVAVALVGAHGNGDTPGACALKVVLPKGRRIEVRPDFDSGTLERLLNVLERV